MENLNSNSKNQWLDFCRAVAIFLVLLSHGRHIITPFTPSFQYFKFGGFLGVELFFVLSGFLIGNILLNKFNSNKSIVNWIFGFLSRRWMRTYPSYFVFFLLNIFLINNIRPAEIPNPLSYLTFTQSLISPHPDFFTEAWSLAVEEVFYFSFPLILMVCSFFIKSKKTVLYSSITLVFLFCFLLKYNAVFYNNMNFNEIRGTTLFRIDSIMIGFLGLIIFKKYGKHWIFNLFLILIPFCVFIASRDDVFLDESKFLRLCLPIISNISFISLLICGISINFHGCLSKIFSFFARISYAAYLSNVPILLSINYFLPGSTSLLHAILKWILFFTLTCGISSAIYYLFEVKILSLRDKLFIR